MQAVAAQRKICTRNGKVHLGAVFLKLQFHRSQHFFHQAAKIECFRFEFRIALFV